MNVNFKLATRYRWLRTTGTTEASVHTAARLPNADYRIDCTAWNHHHTDRWLTDFELQRSYGLEWRKYPTLYTIFHWSAVNTLALCPQVPVFVSWFKLGGRLPNSAEEDGGVLRLYNLQIYDSGVYVCRAVNNETKRVFEDQISITITGECKRKQREFFIR